MFQFTPGQDPFSHQDQNPAYAEDRFVGRVMAMEYNLSVQRGDGPQATGILARMLGQFLANRFGR